MPYITGVDDEGAPQFKTNNEARRVECIYTDRCGMCGQAHSSWYAFIGDAESCESRVFSEPAMHRDCARYVLQACPFLANERYEVRSDDIEVAPWAVKEPLGRRQDPVGLYVCRGYEVVTRGPQVLSRAAPAAKPIRWL